MKYLRGAPLQFLSYNARLILSGKYNITDGGLKVLSLTFVKIRCIIINGKE